MLHKPGLITIIPGTPGRAYRAASYVCTPKAPDGTGGDTDPPPTTPPPTDSANEFHVFVPNNPDFPELGETYEVMGEHPGTGYTCELQDLSSFIVVPTPGGNIVIQNSVVCTWDY